MNTGEAKKSRLFSALGAVLSRKSMRPVTRLFTDLHVQFYRMTGGWAQAPKYPTMLLTTRGRKTGKLRTVPVIYLKDGKNFVVAAAYAGSDQHPAWWLNLQTSKDAEVQVMRTKTRVHAALATTQERTMYWPQLVAMYPYFLDYQKRTQREIPVVILTPM